MASVQNYPVGTPAVTLHGVPLGCSTRLTIEARHLEAGELVFGSENPLPIDSGRRPGYFLEPRRSCSRSLLLLILCGDARCTRGLMVGVDCVADEGLLSSPGEKEKAG